MSTLDTASVLAQAFQHRGRIRQLARKYLSSEARRVYDSEDLVATVFRRILEAEATSASEAQTWEFIRVIASHAAMSQGRKAAVRRRGAAAAAGSIESPREEVSLSVQEALEALTDAETQQVVALRFRGVRFRVIAEAMGISERTAFRRWEEAKRLFEGKGYELVD